MKHLTVRLDDEVHRAVKMRAAADGVAMETLARRWFEDYAAIREAVNADAETINTLKQRVLAAGEAGTFAPPVAEGVVAPAKEPPAPAASTRHVQPDFKEKKRK